jgi:hypothetical protein
VTWDSDLKIRLDAPQEPVPALYCLLEDELTRECERFLQEKHPGITTVRICEWDAHLLSDGRVEINCRADGTTLDRFTLVLGVKKEPTPGGSPEKE